MILFNQERAKQLEGRILKLSVLHKELHSRQFPKDGSKGEYHKHQDLRLEFYKNKKAELGENADSFDIWESPDAPCEWNETESVKHLKRVIRIKNKLKRELLAINYYNAVMNSEESVHNMIGRADDCINKYDYAGLGHGKIELDNLFPKTKEEIAEKERWDSLTPIEKLKDKEVDYQLGRNKEANTKCHEMVVDICEKIVSGDLVSKSDIEGEIETLTDEVGKLSEIVTDYESMDAINCQINKIIKHVQSQNKLETI